MSGRVDGVTTLGIKYNKCIFWNAREILAPGRNKCIRGPALASETYVGWVSGNQID